MNVAWPRFVPVLAWLVMPACATAQDSLPRVLVFSSTSGYRHASIPDGVRAITKLGKENGFVVESSEAAARFNARELQQFRAVVFLNTTGDVLNEEQQRAFEDYITKGGGYVGIHSASDTEYEWPWYGRLVGAYFASHPRIQPARLIVVDSTHPATTGLPRSWDRTDEWYNFRQTPAAVRVLIRIDESSYDGGKNGPHHPMAWFHEVANGRAFYTALGHTEASYQEPHFLAHLLGGIRYAARL